MNIDPAQLTADDVAAVRAVKVEPDPPEHFAEFWRGTAAALAAIPLDLTLQPYTGADDGPAEGAHTSGEPVERGVWTAASLGGRRISGPYARPLHPSADGGLLPQWVYGHGYGSVAGGSGWWVDFAQQGFITVGLDARGYGRSRMEGDPNVPGWILHNISSRDDYILRGAVADTMRAVDVARAMAGADRRRTVLSGGSFSGGLSVLAAPWIDDLRYVGVSVPTFGAYELRRTLVERGSGHEINEYVASLPASERKAVTENLRYYDAVNAAPFLNVPVSVSLGVVDVVVPGETVAAIYHAIGSTDKQLLDYPCSHSTHELAGRWDTWRPHMWEQAVRYTSDQASA